MLRNLLIGLLLCCCPLVAYAAEPAKADATASELLKTFRDEFVTITPGKDGAPDFFIMGRVDGSPSERPPHRVTLPEPLTIARYEVPQNLWRAVMQSNPSRWQGPRNSVEMLSYADAVEFCQRATKLMRAEKLISDKQTVRLPSEAEWEYACRAGSSTAYSFGDDLAKLGDFGWFTGNAAGNDPAVGAKKPNAWKLYDMHGYLWEWCADTWHDDYTGAPTDGSAWTDAKADRRVLRGGSWKDPADRLTSSYRRAASATLKDDAVGLRCVLDSESQQ